ncbi:hypothetical protein L208DRAFT_518045 [Tricholoma matsutake]|nr:hypothetical protein L208DRAFT_518045 [Tricholoma matsutake 945]
MQDLRIGRESRMLIGVAATYFEIDPDLFVHGAADLDDKLAKILEKNRRDVTVEPFLKLVNHEHLETVGILHSLRTLANFIPELGELKSHVSLLFLYAGRKTSYTSTWDQGSTPSSNLQIPSIWTSCGWQRRCRLIML